MPLSVPLGTRDRATGLRWLRPVWAALGASLFAAVAAAQTAPPRPGPSVIVDWSALSALAAVPSQPGLAPVSLHAPPPPPERHVAAAPPRPQPPPLPAAEPRLVPPPPPPQLPPVIAAASPPPAPPPRPPAAAAKPASAPAAMAPAPIGAVQFAPGRSDISPQGQALLQSIAGRLAANAGLRLQLVAYAGASGDDAIEARRIALARALQMRSFLIEKGVASVRMDVRALGNHGNGSGPADRVDLVIVNR